MTIGLYASGFFVVFFGSFLIGYALGAAVGMVSNSLFS